MIEYKGNNMNTLKGTMTKGDFENIIKFNPPIELSSMFVEDWNNFLKYYENENKTKEFKAKVFEAIKALSLGTSNQFLGFYYINGLGYILELDDGSCDRGWNKFILISDNLEDAVDTLMTDYREYISLIDSKSFNPNIRYSFGFDIDLIKEKDVKLYFHIWETLFDFGTTAYYYTCIAHKEIPSNIYELYDNKLNSYDLADNYFEINREFNLADYFKDGQPMENSIILYSYPKTKDNKLKRELN